MFSSLLLLAGCSVDGVVRDNNPDITLTLDVNYQGSNVHY